ncbi:c-type cytochrome [Roseivivax sp. CAU 1753]
MKKPVLLIGAVAVLGIIAYVVFQPARTDATGALPDDALVAVTVPETLSEVETLGQTAFEARCAACHGTNARGRDGKGPPLVHKIYEPSHHGDATFLGAVEQGVRGHHWPFGNMPAQAGLTRADVGAIIAYVRRLQRENGIF